MTEYDLRQWRETTTTAATINIAETKFTSWRTRILCAAADADAEDISYVLKELRVELITDSSQLWLSGFTDSLADCVRLYNKVWNRMRMLFLAKTRKNIMERNGLLNAFAPAIEDLEKEIPE